MLDLAAARHVDVARPVEVIAAMPERAVSVLDAVGDVAEAVLAEDVFHARQAQALLLPRELGRIGDEGLPEVEGDGADHECGQLARSLSRAAAGNASGRCAKTRLAFVRIT